MLHRRGFLTGLICAPAIVKIGSIMPVKAIEVELYGRSPGMAALNELEILRRLRNELIMDIVNPPVVCDYLGTVDMEKTAAIVRIKSEALRRMDRLALLRQREILGPS